MKNISGAGLMVIFILCSHFSYGQKATEIFIPIGQSPGLSGKVTRIGKIDAVNAQEKTLTITGDSGTYTAKVTARTKIWLDKSQLQLPNQKGTFADLQKNRTAEIKNENNERKDKGTAEWIKVQIGKED